MERGINFVIFVAIGGIALLFFAYFFDIWLDKQLIERLKRLKKERERWLRSSVRSKKDFTANRCKYM